MATASPLAAYLEFVRNLTSQIVFGTCYMLLRLRIDTGRLQLDWEGVHNAVALGSCALLLFGTMLANMIRLLNSVPIANEQLDIELMRIRSRRLPLWIATRSLLRAAWRYNKLGMVQFFLVISVSYAGMFVVVEMAAQGALAAVKNLPK